MKKPWRPPDWKNPNEVYHDAFDILTVQDAEYDAYEAGADALLEALFQMAKESPTKTFTIDSRVINIFQQAGE